MTKDTPAGLQVANRFIPRLPSLPLPCSEPDRSGARTTDYESRKPMSIDGIGEVLPAVRRSFRLSGSPGFQLVRRRAVRRVFRPEHGRARPAAALPPIIHRRGAKPAREAPPHLT